MHYWLVMPAAGAGRRFGSAKQFASMGSRSMLEIALQCFAADPQCLGGNIVLASAEPRRDELEHANSELERAYEDRSYYLPSFLTVDERLDNLHSDPRFADLKKRVGLP